MPPKKITIEQQDESFLITIECDKEFLTPLMEKLFDIESKPESKKKS